MFYFFRAIAKGKADGADDLQSARRIDPTNPVIANFATTIYWELMEAALFADLGYMSDRPSPTAANWAKAARDIRSLDPSAVDADALEGGRLLAGICDRWVSVDDKTESGDRLMRVLAGLLRGSAGTAIGDQIDELADAGEANRKDVPRLAEIDALLHRRYTWQGWAKEPLFK